MVRLEQRKAQGDTAWKTKMSFSNELLDFFQQRLRSLPESRDVVIKWKDCEPVSLRVLYLVSLQNATCDRVKY